MPKGQPKLKLKRYGMGQVLIDSLYGAYDGPGPLRSGSDMHNQNKVIEFDVSYGTEHVPGEDTTRPAMFVEATTFGTTDKRELEEGEDEKEKTIKFTLCGWTNAEAMAMKALVSVDTSTLQVALAVQQKLQVEGKSLLPERLRQTDNLLRDECSCKWFKKAKSKHIPGTPWDCAGRAKWCKHMSGVLWKLAFHLDAHPEAALYLNGCEEQYFYPPKPLLPPSIAPTQPGTRKRKDYVDLTLTSSEEDSEEE